MIEDNNKKVDDNYLNINQPPKPPQSKPKFSRSFHSAKENPNNSTSNYSSYNKNKKLKCKRKLNKEISTKKSHTMYSESSLSNSSSRSSGLEFYEKK